MPPTTSVKLRRASTEFVRAAYWPRAFRDDEWPGDHHTFWTAECGGRTVGFCSAVVNSFRECFLSSAAVFRDQRGARLQRRMIRHRLRWAKRHGATDAVTYTVHGNWPSIANLLACGFRVYEPAWPYAGRVVYFHRPL